MSYRNKTSLFFRSHRRVTNVQPQRWPARDWATVAPSQAPCVARVCVPAAVGVPPSAPRVAPAIYLFLSVGCTVYKNGAFIIRIRTQRRSSSASYKRTRIKSFLKHKRLFLNGREPSISRGHCHRRQYKNIHVTITRRVFYSFFKLFFLSNCYY